MTSADHTAPEAAVPGAPPGRGIRRAAALLALLIGGSTVLAATAAASSTSTVANGAPTASVATAADPIQTYGLVPTQTKGQPYRPNFDLQLNPGQEIHDSVRVTNLGSSTLNLNLVATDALNAAGGSIDLLPTGDTPHDAGAWITLDKQSVAIASNDHIDVPFTLKVPSGAEPGDHTAGIVASYMGGTGSTTSGQAVKIDRRIGTRVLIRVAGALKPQLSISNLQTKFHGTVNPLGRGGMDVSYRVTNTGNVRMAVDQAIKVSSPFGIPATTKHPESLTELLPGNSVDVSEKVSGVWPTVRSTTKVSLTPRAARPGDQFPPNVAASAKQGIWTFPWATLIAIVLLLTVLKGRYEMQRRKQQQEAQRLEALLDARMGGSDLTGTVGHSGPGGQA